MCDSNVDVLSVRGLFDFGMSLMSTVCWYRLRSLEIVDVCVSFSTEFMMVYKVLNQYLITDFNIEVSATAMKHLISSGMNESSTSRDTEPVVHVNVYSYCENVSV